LHRSHPNRLRSGLWEIGAVDRQIRNGYFNDARLRRDLVTERRSVEQHIKRAGDGLSLREVEHVVRIRIGGDTRNARGLDVASDDVQLLRA